MWFSMLQVTSLYMLYAKKSSGYLKIKFTHANILKSPINTLDLVLVHSRYITSVVCTVTCKKVFHHSWSPRNDTQPQHYRYKFMFTRDPILHVLTLTCLVPHLSPVQTLSDLPPLGLSDVLHSLPDIDKYPKPDLCTSFYGGYLATRI